MSTGIYSTVLLCNNAIKHLFCTLSTLSIDCWPILEMQTILHHIYVCKSFILPALFWSFRIVVEHMLLLIMMLRTLML